MLLPLQTAAHRLTLVPQTQVAVPALTVNFPRGVSADNNPPAPKFHSGCWGVQSCCLLHRCCQLSAPDNFPFTSLICCVLPWHPVKYSICCVSDHSTNLPSGYFPQDYQLFTQVYFPVPAHSRLYRSASLPYFCPLRQNDGRYVDLWGHRYSTSWVNTL